MNNFEFATPRVALGLAAVAMTAVTLGGLVVLPAQMDSVGPDYFVLTAAVAATRASSEVRDGSVSGDAADVAIRATAGDLNCPAPESRSPSVRQRKFTAPG
jgi:hypothetical protein